MISAARSRKKGIAERGRKRTRPNQIIQWKKEKTDKAIEEKHGRNAVVIRPELKKMKSRKREDGIEIN